MCENCDIVTRAEDGDPYAEQELRKRRRASLVEGIEAWTSAAQFIIYSTENMHGTLSPQQAREFTKSVDLTVHTLQVILENMRAADHLNAQLENLL